MAALRRSSLEIVDATAPEPASDLLHGVALNAKERGSPPAPANVEIPTTRAASPASPNIDGGMPPAFLNHRVHTTACGTPTPTAASSLAVPAAIAAQNRRRLTLALPPAVGLVRTSAPAQNDPERRFRMFIATPVSRCCDDHLNPPNTSPSDTPSAWRRPASSLRWVASATLTTMLSPKPSTASTRPRSSIGVDHGAHARPSSSPRSNGSTGSTIAGCWNPSATSRRPKPRSATTPC